MSRIYEALKQLAGERRSPKTPSPASSGAGNGHRTASLAMGILASSGTGPVANAFPAGLLQELRQQCPQPGWALTSNSNVFAAAPSLCAEQFRKLRSRLYQLQNTQPIRILQVTSALPGEGKTFVAFNLALALSRDRGRRILLIDADLRASTLARQVGAPGSPGLSDYLRGAAGEFSVIQRDTSADLFFLPAGDPVEDPTELLASGRFQGLLERVAPAFDWIIVDTPPVLPVSDAGVLAGACDGALLVVRAAATGFDQVEAALKELQATKLLGVVLNQAEEDELPRGAYLYYAGMASGSPAPSLGSGSRPRFS